MNDALMQCDCCDYFTIPTGSEYDICRICFWEQDCFGISKPDQRSGANHGLTLRQGRWNFQKYQACAERFTEDVISEPSRQKFKRAIRQLSEYEICIVDCINVIDETGFWEAYIRAINPDGAQFFGRNLDAFWDALHGGPGCPDINTVYFVNTSIVKTFKEGTFYSAVKAIAEESGAAVYVE